MALLPPAFRFLFLLACLPLFVSVTDPQAQISQEELDPSLLMSYVHDSDPSEAVIHQFARNILSITKDLVSHSARSSKPRLTIHERLKTLQNLPPDQLNALLAQQNIVVPPLVGVACEQNALYYRTMNGACNNREYPCWGKSDEPYQRWLPPHYGNGVDSPRTRADGRPLPSPRLIYQWVSSQFEQSPNTTYHHLNSLMVVWGQLLSHDILLTPTVTVKVWDGKVFKHKVPDCCKVSHPDCVPIQMDYDDGYYGHGHCMDIVRSAAYTYSPFSCRPFKLGLPREQMNQLSSFIDASFVYGSTEAHMRKLRDGGGFGATLHMDYQGGYSYPPRANKTCKVSHNVCDKRCFLTGEKRGNENPVLGAFHTIWSREHNRLVEALRPRGWPDETLFHVVRKIIGAFVQHITYKEYLPLVLGQTLPELMDLSVPTAHYQYDPTVNPTLYNVFVTAAFRYGHSMVSSRHMRLGGSMGASPLLSRDFFSMDDFCHPQADAVITLLAGQADQPAQKVDGLFSKQITNHLFAKNENGPGLDLFSVNIQRGRDHGLPPYNRWREACGLPVAKDYSEMKRSIPDYIVDRLAAIYGPGSVDEVDLYVAGVTEFPVNGGILGPTFTCIVSNQFKNLKYGDRFWYENTQHAGAFTQEQIQAIQKTTLASLICRNSEIMELQPLVFQLPSAANPKMYCDDIKRQTDLDLSLWP